MSRRGPLRLYYFVFFGAIGAYNPYFPTWLHARGIDGVRMSTITMLVPLLGVLGPVVFGVLADAFGLRGSLLRLAAGGALVSFGAIAALGAGGDAASYARLFALMALYSFFRAPMVTLADVTALEQTGSYGRTRLFGSAGFTAAVVLVGVFVDPRRERELPFVITGVLAATLVVTAALQTRTVRPSTPILRDAAELLRSSDFLLFLLVGFLWFSSHVSYDLCFSMHLLDLGATNRVVGICWAIGVIAEILLMSAAHRLLPHHSTTKLMAFGVLATCVRFAVIAHVRSVGTLLLLSPAHALSFGLFWIASLEFVRHRAPAHVLATAQSLLAAVMATGSVLGMYAWGPLYAARGGAPVFAAASAVAAVGAVAALGLVRGRASRAI